MTIEPDTKDWTWVLERPCAECGFDATHVDPRTYADRVAAMGPLWRTVLERPDGRVRPDASTWSPLEYACHVRDVFDVFAGRIDQMVASDGARFANWDQDAAATAGDYGRQDPDAVADALTSGATRLARTIAAVPSGAWGHRGLRSNGSAFTVDSIVLYLAHDLEHHLVDVGA